MFFYFTHREKTDTEVTTFLSKNSRGYITSKLRADEINDFFQGKHCLCLEILNKSFEDIIEIEKRQPIGFFVVEPENLKFQHVPRKTWLKRKRKVTRWKTRRQIGGFLNCYDFAYAGRDTVNQAAKVTRSIIKGVTDEINIIAQQRIDQIISQEGKEIERVLPRIFRGAIEDVYQTPFRLPGDFGKKQLKKLKNKF